jgi:5-methyltetrahydrofolate--homocysteine methyltransferase
LTTLTSKNGELKFGAGQPTMLINDQLRIFDQSRQVLAELKEGRFDHLLNLARWGKQVGTQAVDLLITHPDIDEVELLPRIAAAVHEEIGCPISLDTRSPEALEAALKALQPYKAMVNSVSAEEPVLQTLLPIAARYGAAVIGIPIGEKEGIPHTVEGRIRETEMILEAALKHGIAKDDLVIDAICLATAVIPDSMQLTLETLHVLAEDMGLTTILGIGNAGHGMPAPTVIDLAYLIAAIPWGLHAALVDPTADGLIETVLAVDFLTGRDPFGRRYIAHHRGRKRNQ